MLNGKKTFIVHVANNRLRVRSISVHLNNIRLFDLIIPQITETRACSIDALLITHPSGKVPMIKY